MMDKYLKDIKEAEVIAGGNRALYESYEGD